MQDCIFLNIEQTVEQIYFNIPRGKNLQKPAKTSNATDQKSWSDYFRGHTKKKA